MLGALRLIVPASAVNSSAITIGIAPSGWVAIPSEGGHVSFAAEDAEELAIVERFKEGRGHVSAERLISGPGLAHLYQVLGEMRETHAGPPSIADIVKYALEGEDRKRVFYCRDGL